MFTRVHIQICISAKGGGIWSHTCFVKPGEKTPQNIYCIAVEIERTDQIRCFMSYFQLKVVRSKALSVVMEMLTVLQGWVHRDWEEQCVPGVVYL